ncbi:hypothetical protein C8Q80DRAFT_1302188 [Daedaleopsis nitida]|nr:hypothetical protein C8Q80DRAFT_1302188 [Daedaleopsis nitida]
MQHLKNDSLQEVSRVRLLPISGTVGTVHTTPLSILDNSVVRFALTSAVWYFDPGDDATNGLSSTELADSLQITVYSYPHWTGQLHWLPYNPAAGQRHGRVAVTHGSPNDPGIELIQATHARSLASLVPDSEERIARGAWDANACPSAHLLCPTSLALHNTDECAGQPCVSVQLTTFVCGGLAVAVRIVHCIADAIALFQFVKDWSAVHRARSARMPLPRLAPLFDPALVDGEAAGDLACDAPDPTLLAIERSLPMHRYDWWASADGCPAPMRDATQVPDVLRGADLGPPGEPMPWADWDVFAPAAHFLVYFTPGEVRRMWEDASQPTSTPTTGAARVSRLDALLAFVWRLVVRARGMARDPALVNMAVTVGLRSRVAPRLPDNVLGSPITLVRVSLPGTEIAGFGSELGAPTLAAAASAIRAAMAEFTPAALGALLHEMAHAVNPQRTWRAFLGRRHSIVTSWQNLDAYGVDFGGGRAPRYVDAVMPSMDGCLHVMEAGPASAAPGAGRWYDEPVCVSLHLVENVMESLLKDPELRKYRDG